ncbi:MAG: UDP-N-acetylglucosamine 1-carboxyvinyltransferase [Oscillospiraceae bacterium]|jgi:UDP-N-acetylglucosamine 1-carboxyvinyltransferase|nr:UDP-N-acetylglucosamine 1-carboxyvinyltransferase [Oscillospiraceae bacterium]
MSRLRISGPCRLHGELQVHGAKNSALPLLAASLLCSTPCELQNCPHLSDVDTAIAILRELGCRVSFEGDTVVVDSRPASACEISDALMREMRSSIIFLGAILGRAGEASLSFPGGCELGPRPIDLHLQALRRLGVNIIEDHGRLTCTVPDGLHGAEIALAFPSVGATENVMIAASVARGTTVLENAAREPEIEDLAGFLNACGAQIIGAGTGTVRIEGVSRLTGCTYHVIPDRIAAATYLAAAAATGSQLTLLGVIPRHLRPVLPVLEEAGCRIWTHQNTLEILPPRVLNRVHLVRTMPYPGFPTDAQAPIMAMTTVAHGTSVFVENIFEERYKHVGELLRMGANIRVDGRVAVVEGVPGLSGAPVEAADLRGGAALVIAGLVAQGQTIVSGIHHIDRGYEHIEQSLQKLGADVERIPDTEDE